LGEIRKEPLDEPLELELELEEALAAAKMTVLNIYLST
jgi:hypothetical protein